MGTNPFRELISSGLSEEAAYAAKQRASFEERVVLSLFDRFQLRQPLPEMRDECRRSMGNLWLSLDWWETLHPSFPLHLAARIIPNVYRVSAADWLNRLTNTIIFDEWESVLYEIPLEQRVRSVGMVFEWPVLHTTVVFHNTVLDTDADGSALFKRMAKLGCFTIQPLSSFLAGLAWSP